jgi:hypothetical protein
MGFHPDVITHLVLLKPHQHLPPADRHAFIVAFERALREIPTIRAVRIGTRITHGAAYELTAPDTADFMAAIDFEDLAGVRAYLAHPAHAELGKLFGEVLSSSLVFDFEVGGVEILEDHIPL